MIRRFVVPHRAAVHRHALVRAAVETLSLMFEHRADLGRPIRNAHGNIIVRALPELLVRPFPGESSKELEQRRADWMQRLLETMLVAIACCDFRRKVLRVPEFDQLGPGEDSMLSLRRWAAEVGLSEADYVDPVNGIERAVRFLGYLGFITKTKQWRERKPDGAFRATGAALRRIGFAFLYHIGGQLERVARATHAEEKRQAENERRAEEEASRQFTAAVAQVYDDAGDDADAPELPEPAPELAPDPHFATIEREHADWIRDNDMSKINAELRRLRRAAATPNTS